MEDKKIKIFVVQTDYYDDNSVEFVTTNVENLIDYIVKDEKDKITVKKLEISVWEDELKLCSSPIYDVPDLFILLKSTGCDLTYIIKLLKKEEQYNLNKENLKKKKLEEKEYNKYLKLKSKYENI